jgi:hypothetical protein
MITFNASKGKDYPWNGFVCLSVRTLDKVPSWKEFKICLCLSVMRTLRYQDLMVYPFLTENRMWLYICLLVCLDVMATFGILGHFFRTKKLSKKVYIFGYLIGWVFLDFQIELWCKYFGYFFINWTNFNTCFWSHWFGQSDGVLFFKLSKKSRILSARLG